MQDIPALPAISCSQCSTSAAIVFDKPTGRVARFCLSCQHIVPHNVDSRPSLTPVPPVTVPQPINDPSADWFSHGPLSKFASLCGWVRGNATPPGSGTQSWLFCPLISLGLAVAESRMSVPPCSTFLSNLSSGLPTHFPSSVPTQLIFICWTVTNLQLHCRSRGKVDTSIFVAKKKGCHPSRHHVNDRSLAL